jgi:hypothetical protein
MMTSNGKKIAGAFAALALSVAAPGRAGAAFADFEAAWGPRYRLHGSSPAAALQTQASEIGAIGWVHHWNRIAVDASGLDHTPASPGENRVFGEELGPGRSSRAMAIVHIAVFEALNAAAGRYQSYIGLPRQRQRFAMRGAVAQAARDTLVAMYPSQKAHFDAELANDLRQVGTGIARSNGIALGRRIAATILALRAHDGAQHAEPVVGVDYIPGNGAGEWRQDPISQIPIALGAHWGEVQPFVLESSDQFRVPEPPALSSAAYATAYNEVKVLGGDGVTTQTVRTADQTFIGVFWAYDGTPSLCAPPRLYNQIAVQIADQMGTGAIELGRLLALVNTAMADAGIGVWESKYFYKLWRPVTGIRESDPGTGPTGSGDGNPATIGDPTFSPLGAPASNLNGPNFTPPFPSYPSGHAGFGGALFETLRRFYRRDNIRFTFVSDEFNGVTAGNDGQVRPFRPRTFNSLSQAEEENGQSRIYLGIHWSYDKTEGITQGRRIADYVFDNAFVPLR